MKQKLAAAQARALQVAEQKRRHEEKQYVRRQRQQAENEATTATPPTAQKPLGWQPFADEASINDLFDAPDLPFPMAMVRDHTEAASAPLMSAEEQPQTETAISTTAAGVPSKYERLAVPLSACANKQLQTQTTVPGIAGSHPSEERKVAASSHVHVDEQLYSWPTTPITTDLFPSVELCRTMSDETLAPAGSDPEQCPEPPSAAVSDPSRENIYRQSSPRRSPRAHDTRREMAAPPALVMRAAMLHWRALWRRPRQLYRYLLGRPLFRRASRQVEDAVIQ